MKSPLRSLPTRIVLFVFAATVVTSLIVTAVSIHTIDDFLREKIEQKYADVLAQTEHALDDWYDERLRELGVFAESPVLVDHLARLTSGESNARTRRARSEAEQYLRYVLDSFPQYAAIYIRDDQGELLLWVGEEISKLVEGLGDTPYREGGGLGPALRLAGRTVQIASAPLRSDEAPAGASLNAALRVTDLRPVLEPDGLGLSGRVFIVDDEGRYMTGSAPLPLVAYYSGPLQRAPESGSETTEYTSDTGEHVVGSTRRYDRMDWHIVVEQLYGEAFEPVVASIGRVLVINLGSVLVAGLLAWRIAVSIVRPIEALSSAARRISEGDRETPIPQSGSSDEVGVLTQAFSDMTRWLTNNARELEASHAQVAEANRQLKEQNDELQRVNEVLEQLSITDGLTKLHNHRYFQEALLQETRRAARTQKPLSLILIDIDFFKAWNDRLGHAAGDEILRRLAEVLNALIRETDLLARYGGEEFALLTPGTDIEGATLLAEKIRHTVANTEFVLDLPSEQGPVTVSIGVASWQAPSEHTSLFNEADRALYRAKAAGRDCVVAADGSAPESPSRTS